MSVVDEIKQRLDIVEMISGYVPLQKAGRNYKGLCPFHSEKTPSFIVFPESQNWHCFGACATGGDIFTFLQKMENLNFSEALRLLADRTGVELLPKTQAAEAEDLARQRLREVNAAAAGYFHYLLTKSPLAAGARGYVERRGLTPDTVELFQLGYAPESWDALSNYLMGKGYAMSDLHAAGLIIEREGGGYYDRFRNRLMFPIHDLKGSTIGFGARALDDSMPKYLNSPQTLLFNKSETLYGLDLARDTIRQTGTIVVVEGYMDVITAHQHGYKNVVASLGTALTEAQLRLARRFTKRFILALDADAAGNQATLRGIEVARSSMSDQIVPVPTWQGFIHYESRLNAELRILVVPEGKDPDDFIRASPAGWPDLVEKALPVIEYYFQTLSADLDVQDPKQKAEVARRLLPLIHQIGNRVEQAHYLQKLAALIRVDERTLADQWRELRGQARHAAQRPSEQIPMTKSQKPESVMGHGSSVIGGERFEVEERCLAGLIQNPWLLGPLSSLFEKVGTHPLEAMDYSRTANREIFAVLQELWTSRAVPDLARLRSALDPSLHAHLTFLLQRLGQEPPLNADQQALQLCIDCLVLRERNLKRRNEEIRFLQEEARQTQDPTQLTEYNQRASAIWNEMACVHRMLNDRMTLGREVKTILAQFWQADGTSVGSENG